MAGAGALLRSGRCEVAGQAGEGVGPPCPVQFASRIGSGRARTDRRITSESSCRGRTMAAARWALRTARGAMVGTAVACCPGTSRGHGAVSTWGRCLRCQAAGAYALSLPADLAVKQGAPAGRHSASIGCPVLIPALLRIGGTMKVCAHVQGVFDPGPASSGSLPSWLRWLCRTRSC